MRRFHPNLVSILHSCRGGTLPFRTPRAYLPLISSEGVARPHRTDIFSDLISLSVRRHAAR
eukprot:15455433-Heterocapsa_arctica.AAC.1